MTLNFWLDYLYVIFSIQLYKSVFSFLKGNKWGKIDEYCTYVREECGVDISVCAFAGQTKGVTRKRMKQTSASDVAKNLLLFDNSTVSIQKASFRELSILMWIFKSRVSRFITVYTLYTRHLFYFIFLYFAPPPQLWTPPVPDSMRRLTMFSCSSQVTLLHFALQSSHLNMCYYHQDSNWTSHPTHCGIVLKTPVAGTAGYGPMLQGLTRTVFSFLRR